MSFDFCDPTPCSEGTPEMSATSELIVNPKSNVESNTREEEVTHRLGKLKILKSGCQFEMACLLREVQEHELWKVQFRSFKEYCETVVEMKIRTVQEMLRVLRTCEEFGIHAEEIQQFGWSKVAVLAAQITSENVEQCLFDLGSLSFHQLRQKYCRPKAPKEKLQDDEIRELILTKCILDAMEYAGQQTDSDSDQENLEHVARMFIELTAASNRFDLIVRNN